MDIKKNTIEKYEKPVLEVVEFEIEESIAVSGASFADSICSEGLFDWE
jgi:hypothetical protein